MMGFLDKLLDVFRPEKGEPFGFIPKDGSVFRPAGRDKPAYEFKERDPGLFLHIRFAEVIIKFLDGCRDFSALKSSKIKVNGCSYSARIEPVFEGEGVGFVISCKGMPDLIMPIRGRGDDDDFVLDLNLQFGSDDLKIAFAKFISGVLVQALWNFVEKNDDQNAEGFIGAYVDDSDEIMRSALREQGFVDWKEGFMYMSLTHEQLDVEELVRTPRDDTVLVEIGRRLSMTTEDFALYTRFC